jgi:tetratricopeptide (TPR) repeat protein
MEIARRLERFREVLSRIYRSLKVNAPVPTYVFVFRDDASFTPYKKRFEGRPVELAGSFAGVGDANYVALNGSSQADPLSVIYHEYIQYFVHNNLPHLPLWFDEGVAECYETFRADEKLAQVGRPVHQHIQTLRSGPLMPLPDLFAITPRSRDYNEGNRRSIFYAQSWALTHYLLWGNPARKPQLVQFLDRLREGMDTDEAFQASFLTTQDKLEVELKRYVNQGRFLFSGVRLDELEYDAGATITSMGRAEALHRLGEYLVQTQPDRSEDAERHFRAALAADPDHASSHAGLGMIQDRAGRAAQAAEHFERALTLDRNDYRIAYRYAEHLLGADESGTGAPSPDHAPSPIVRARELFGTSIALEPGFAEAYVGYGLTYFRTRGSVAPGITMLEKAALMLPSRTDVLRNLAVLYAAEGRWGEARALVDRVLARMNDPEALRSAKDALARMEPERPAAPEPAPPAEIDGEGAKGSAPQTDEPGLESPVTGTTRDTGDSGEYNRQVAVYNRAVELANRRDYKAAIALLETLIPRISDESLAAQAKALLERFKKDSARRGMRAP